MTNELKYPLTFTVSVAGCELARSSALESTRWPKAS